MKKINKTSLVNDYNVVVSLRKALERQQAEITAAVETLHKNLGVDRWSGNTDEESYDPKAIVSFLRNYVPPRVLNDELVTESISALRGIERAVGTVIATNTIHLYELQIPSNVHGSIGDISQFEKDMDPIE